MSGSSQTCTTGGRVQGVVALANRFETATEIVRALSPASGGLPSAGCSSALSLGLSYSEHARPSGSETFHHVYLEPSAYEELARTGEFPEGTRLVLEIHRRAERAPPSLQGYFEGERLAVEVAVKDSEAFEEGWAYFDFSNGRQASRVFPRGQCFDCHVEHGARDNVFTQFYPVLRRLETAP